jgi:hypothetical protein
MESTWESREMLILRAVDYFDDPERHHVDIDDLVAATGLDEDDVKRGLRALGTASPPYVQGIAIAETVYPISLTEVTERARREVGQWPTPEAWVDRLVAGLEQAADDEPNEEKRSRIKQAAGVLGGIARDVAVKAASGAITGAM